MLFLPLFFSPPPDGIFEYLDTYEDKALKLKRARHEGEQSMAKLESELKEVSYHTPAIINWSLRHVINNVDFEIKY